MMYIIAEENVKNSTYVSIIADTTIVGIPIIDDLISEW